MTARGPFRRYILWRGEIVGLILAANVAWGWYFAAQYIADDYLLPLNSARWLMILTAPPGQHENPSATRSSNDGGSVPDFEQEWQNMTRQSALFEGIVAVWRYAMWVVAGCIGLAVLLSALFGWARGFMIGAGFIIQLSVLLSLGAVYFIGPPQSRLAWYIGCSAVGWFLWAAPVAAISRRFLRYVITLVLVSGACVAAVWFGPGMINADFPWSSLSGGLQALDPLAYLIVGFAQSLPGWLMILLVSRRRPARRGSPA